MCAEPVKLTMSWPVRWSKRSPTPPTISSDRTSGEHVRLDHDLERGFGEVRGRGGGLHDGGHACKDRRRELFEHSPHREIEGVDVDGRPVERGVDVLADEGAVLRQPF